MDERKELEKTILGYFRAERSAMFHPAYDTCLLLCENQNKINSIINELDRDNVYKVEKWDRRLTVYFKNGDRIIKLAPHESMKGFRYTSMIIDLDMYIDKEIWYTLHRHMGIFCTQNNNKFI